MSKLPPSPEQVAELRRIAETAPGGPGGQSPEAKAYRRAQGRAQAARYRAEARARR